MKKFTKIFIFIIFIGLLTGCTSKDALKFKEEYESLNGETNKNNKEYRVITIDKNNPFIYMNLKDINKKVEKKETFLVYFGANWCPWCRSLLPTAIEEAHKKGIKKIYYVNVRPSTDEKDDIRDIYDVDDNNKIFLSHEGTEDYHKFLEIAAPVLKDYSSHGVEVKDKKRVGAPNFIIFKKGKPILMDEGTSDKLTDPYMELTDDIINDMVKIFDNLYDEYLK